MDGAVALTLRQDSHQLSLSGRGDSVARWPLSVSRHATAPAGDAAAAGAAGHAPDSE
ncbi:hypothetical protein IE979_19665 [Klebsiella pneumoniae]|uniref:Uncharacterized protein n=1 Tax=Klebsiella pneumoniae TaxID=573 RepID=A0A927DPD1_KLEPN|nr:hypothetical protein [Klebsiella pneumoniae]